MIIICLLESSNHLYKGFIHQNEQTNSFFFDLCKAIKIIKVTPGGNTIHVTKKVALKWAIV